ncbi:ROK family transcriptional regulator [Evansella halocellulosilytica]|uniref:ROK family transcriptional regulator n=1 Tax=Evansella halocellulosilytica TaxID=2011013 RepID=UPI000BB82F81|nr:ROK family transcriptional regulator [Evansella halocellulosilytica]
MKRPKTSTPNYLKYLNKKKVLHYLKQHANISRSEIASALSISKPTVSSLVDELIEEQWVVEKESDVSTSLGGRKPIHLSFNRDARYIVGVDIGGTTVEIGIVNINGDVLATDSFETQAALKDSLVRTICTVFKKLMKRLHIDEKKFLAIGVGAPGMTDADNGIVIDAPSLSWINFPLKQKLEDALNIPVYVDNDVNVGVLGEQWKGKAKNSKHVILITLGTGVGCGIIMNGMLYRGSAFAAGEIGYMVTDKERAKEDYDDIYLGYGFLDSHVGGPAIAKRMKKKLTDIQHHSLKNSVFTAKQVFEYAKANDPAAIEVIQEALEHLAFALLNVICIFNPQYVILAGGISKSGHWFLPKIQEILANHLPVQTEIFITETEHVTIIGAAALCLREHESILQVEGGR